MEEDKTRNRQLKNCRAEAQRSKKKKVQEDKGSDESHEHLVSRWGN